MNSAHNNINPLSSSCEGKHRFTDQGLAIKTAKKSSRRHDARMSAYLCKFCNGWHIGQHIRHKSEGKKPRADVNYFLLEMA